MTHPTVSRSVLDPVVRVLGRLLPGVAVARGYRREWLARDVAAGVVISCLLAPAGMAYAQASGLPPVTGLYATIVPALVYALVGPSRILVIGPDSALAPLIAAAVVPLMATSSAEAVALGSALAIIAGLMCFVAGLARFGFLSELLSAPVRYGYLHGIALTIVVAQVAKMSGVSASGENMIELATSFVRELERSGLSAPALAVGAVSVAVVVGARLVDHRLPAPLLAVIVGIAAATWFGLADRGVGVVGDLPQGFPLPSLPHIGDAPIRTLVSASVGIALVAFADTSVLSRTMALRRREHVDSNQELAALGIANMASGFFSGFPVSGSNSRTPVAEAAGSRSQLTGVTAALVLIALTTLVPSTFRNLPDATLAAIVLVAALRLIDVGAMRRLLAVRRSEFVLAVTALLAVAVLGPVNGVVVAVTLSVLNFLRIVWKPHTAELVRVDGLKGYHDRERHPEGRVIPGLLLYRFDAPLFFGNARYFASDLEGRVAERAANGEPVRCVVITAEPMTDIDSSAADTLHDTLSNLRRAGIEVRFAEMKGLVREQFDRYGIAPGSELRNTDRTTGQAVHAYVNDYGVDWTDWDER